MTPCSEAASSPKVRIEEELSSLNGGSNDEFLVIPKSCSSSGD
jgi:hypothetical protein